MGVGVNATLHSPSLEDQDDIDNDRIEKVPNESVAIKIPLYGPVTGGYQYLEIMSQDENDSYEIYPEFYKKYKPVKNALFFAGWCWSLEGETKAPMWNQALSSDLGAYVGFTFGATFKFMRDCGRQLIDNMKIPVKGESVGDQGGNIRYDMEMGHNAEAVNRQAKAYCNMRESGDDETEPGKGINIRAPL